MTVAIVYGRVAEDAPEDEKDVLAQAQEIREALARLGHQTFDVPVSLDLQASAELLSQRRPEIAFNITDTVEGRGNLIHLAPSLLDSLGIRYTGCPFEAIVLTSNKLLAKRALAAAWIPTPAWSTARAALEGVPAFGPPFIIKSVWEHASIGMDDSAVVMKSSQLCASLRKREACGDAVDGLFVEAYVDGREFNLALLARPGHREPDVLPPAEIDFVGYPEGKPRVVGYKAKWEAGSFEYGNTPRRFDYPAQDARLLSELRRLALACWEQFALKGYARVDFRVGWDGRPWVLEINTNPCLSSDAGFMAAAGRAGLTREEVVGRILSDGLRAREVSRS